MVSIDNARLEAWFMDSRDKSDLPKNLVSMFSQSLGNSGCHCIAGSTGVSAP